MSKPDYKSIVKAQDPAAWANIPASEFIRGSVHEILNQLTGIKALLDLMHTTQSFPTAEPDYTISPILDDAEMVEMVDAARDSCRNVITALNLMYGYAQSTDETSPNDSAT